MANTKLSALAAGSAIADADLFYSSQSNTSVSQSASALRTYVLKNTGAAIAPPQGRLTLTSGVPVMVGDATAQTSIYYAPYVGAMIPIWNGTVWVQTPFSQLTMALDTTNHPASQAFDLFVWNNSGTVAIGAGPTWTNSATITVTIATPAVVSWTAHGLSEGDPVIFTTTGALPTGITAGTTYFVGRSPGTNSFNISTSVANAAAGTFVATSGTQSGTQTATNHTRVRGTGAGTTQLQQLNGVWTNAVSITLTNGAGAGTSGVAANTATYVGSFYTTANGQTGIALLPAAAGGGTNNIVGLWNAYNQVSLRALNRDNTATWTYNGATVRAMNNNVANRITFLDGLQISPIKGVHTGMSSAAVDGFIAMNLNSTNTTPQVSGGSNSTNGAAMGVNDQWYPVLGVSFLQAVEMAPGGTKTFFGSLDSQQANALILEIAA